MVRRCYICCYRHADPNIGEFHIHQMTQEDVPPFEVTQVLTTLAFNPRRDLASPETALAFFSTALAPYGDELGAFGGDIAQNAATMAFADAQNGEWQHGMLVMLVLESFPDPTGFIVPPPRDPSEAAAGGIMVMEDPADLAVPGDASPSPQANLDVEGNDWNDNGDDGDDEEEEEAPVGLSESEISMLKKEELESDAIDEESCCVCLEEFKAGEVITPLSPCSHKFHNLCIVEWLRKNGTCPICRSICRVD